jgi:hypothetical protein
MSHSFDHAHSFEGSDGFNPLDSDRSIGLNLLESSQAVWLSSSAGMDVDSDVNTDAARRDAPAATTGKENSSANWYDGWATVNDTPVNAAPDVDTARGTTAATNQDAPANDSGIADAASDSDPMWSDVARDLSPAGSSGSDKTMKPNVSRRRSKESISGENAGDSIPPAPFVFDLSGVPKRKNIEGNGPNKRTYVEVDRSERMRRDLRDERAHSVQTRQVLRDKLKVRFNALQTMYENDRSNKLQASHYSRKIEALEGMVRNEFEDMKTRNAQLQGEMRQKEEAHRREVEEIRAELQRTRVSNTERHLISVRLIIPIRSITFYSTARQTNWRQLSKGLSTNMRLQKNQRRSQQ